MHERCGHAHNLLLEAALLYGIQIAIVVAALQCLNIKDSIYSKIPMMPEITAFIVVLGMVESPLVGTPAPPFWHIGWLRCSPDRLRCERLGNRSRNGWKLPHAASNLPWHNYEK